MTVPAPVLAVLGAAAATAALVWAWSAWGGAGALLLMSGAPAC